MQMENLQLFCDLAETQSFTRAAEKNGITTSAVSQKFLILECRTGQVLASRNNRFFQLTAAGEIYYQHASETADESNWWRETHELRGPRIPTGFRHSAQGWRGPRPDWPSEPTLGHALFFITTPTGLHHLRNETSQPRWG